MLHFSPDLVDKSPILIPGVPDCQIYGSASLHYDLSNIMSVTSLLTFPFVFAEIYLLYAKLEMEHGMARHAMAVYDRATRAVLPEEQNEVCLLYFYILKFFFFC